MLLLDLFILYACYSNVLTHVEKEYNEFSSPKTFRSNLDKKENNVGDMDYEEKRQIVKQYLATLNKAEDNWIDPHDMLASVDGKLSSSQTLEESIIENNFKPMLNDISSEVIVSNSAHKDETDNINNDSNILISNHRDQVCNSDSIYISRWLKMLIYKIDTDIYLEPSALVIPLDSDSLSKLKTMTNENIHLKDLDETFSNLISRATLTNGEMHGLSSLIVWAFSSNFVRVMLVVVLLGIFAYFFYIFLILRPIWTIFWCLVLICIFWHWMHLYQKAIAFKHSQLSSSQIPSECRKNEFSFFESVGEFFKSFFVSSDCLKYYEALMVDPLWEVSLSVAISETISAMAFQPLYRAAHALNGAVKLLFDGLPITSMVIVVIFLFLLIVMLFGYRIKLPFFMGAIEPGYVQQRNYIEDVKPNKAINVISDLVQKSAESIEKVDNKISGLLQSELLHKDPNRDLSIKGKIVRLNQGAKKESNLISREIEGHMIGHVVIVGDDKLSKKLCEAKNLQIGNCNSEEDICKTNASFSNSELIETNKDAFVENTNFDCDSNVQQQNDSCKMSEKK